MQDQPLRMSERTIRASSAASMLRRERSGTNRRPSGASACPGSVSGAYGLRSKAAHTDAC